MSKLYVADRDTNLWLGMNIADRSLLSVSDPPPIYRINCGGSQINRTTLAWSADTESNPSSYVSGGGNSIASTSNQIALDSSVPGDVPVSLFQTERYDSDQSTRMTYTLPAQSNSNYRIRLYFAEIFGGAQAVGARIMQVSINGQVVLSDYDTYAEVGGYTGQAKTFNLATGATENNIVIELGPNTIQSPRIQGIEILSSDGVPLVLSGTSGDRQATLTWNVAGSYSLLRSTTQGGPYTTIATNLTGTSYTNIELINGTTYYYILQGETTSNEVSVTPADVTQGELVWQMPFNEWGSGQVTQSRLQASGLDMNWGMAHSDRSAIVNDPFEASGQKVLRVNHQQQTSSTSLQNDSLLFGGVLPVGTASEKSLILEYDVAFGPNFAFERPDGSKSGGWGGKLPGLAGAGSGVNAPQSCDTTDGGATSSGGFSFRHMWHQYNSGSCSNASGPLTVYAYWKDKNSSCGDNWCFPMAPFQAQRWYKIKQQIDINDVGQANGRVRAWLNGELMIDRQNLVIRTSTAYSINQFKFHCYFGGATPAWGHTHQEELIYFRNLKVTRPI